MAIANGRISARTWPQYQAWHWLFAPVLQLADEVLVQSAADFERYSLLGVPAQRLSIAGNLKYDAASAPPPAKLPSFDAEHVWIAASTAGPNEAGSLTKHSVDEDDIVISAFTELAREFPRTLLILAPRQPARFGEVARKLEASGFPWSSRSASAGDSPPDIALPGVLLLDAIGELAGLYARAHVVFVGGSLAQRAAATTSSSQPSRAFPLWSGPHMQNFEAIAGDFIEQQAGDRSDSRRAGTCRSDPRSAEESPSRERPWAGARCILSSASREFRARS